jgi:hypothetical protein
VIPGGNLHGGGLKIGVGMTTFNREVGKFALGLGENAFAFEHEGSS